MYYEFTLCQNQIGAIYLSGVVRKNATSNTPSRHFLINFIEHFQMISCIFFFEASRFPKLVLDFWRIFQKRKPPEKNTEKFSKNPKTIKSIETSKTWNHLNKFYKMFEKNYFHCLGLTYHHSREKKTKLFLPKSSFRENHNSKKFL